ncbi:hypothetical protein BJF85_23955 [Saccharomonospora sp. CUA-673]|uniref:AbrB/MazE/SpoVT family DNA-binding domain-containing protein n=1 Tax=Saccharomonospora sp. CUA-673 TaxID=1904969 RepID=UPI00095F38DA|nr:AbrB/MazE/SpoVT family DNA-binding domain-containing protein [Saccharomonospora sp. CUA-673]OLT41340.1 hypothetical protein BJF85_23955 [Saccharomonospora sp. CUA-673]
MGDDEQSGKFAAIVKVGPKGQIVIPKEAREMFDIEPGASLLLLADETKGIAIVRKEPFREFIDAVMPDIRSES